MLSNDHSYPPPTTTPSPNYNLPPPLPPPPTTTFLHHYPLPQLLAPQPLPPPPTTTSPPQSPPPPLPPHTTTPSPNYYLPPLPPTTTPHYPPSPHYQSIGGDTTIVTNLRGFSYEDDDFLHGIHIHHSGDVSEGCEYTGEHYNPTGVQHGEPLYGERLVQTSV